MSQLAQKQLRHILAVRSGATPASGNADYWDGEILWATPEDISGLGDYWLRSTRRKITLAGYESCGVSIAPPRSILLTKRAPIGQVALLAEAACSNQGCFLLTPKDSTNDTRYYYYWFSVHAEYLQILGRGTTFMELSIDELKSLQVPVLPLQHQHAIADYLDRETARLDALVAAKEQVLMLLAEKRQALITKAVTRGINSTKQSAAPTRGDLLSEGNRRGPEASGGKDCAAVAGGDDVNKYGACHRRLKYVATINDDVLDEDTDDNYELQYIDIGNVYSSKAIQEPVMYQFKDAPGRARRRVRDGDIIISCVRTYLQAIARIQTPPENLVVSTGFAVVRPSAAFLSPNFANYALRDPSFLAEIEKRSVGVSYPAINASDLADISICLPSLREQRAIADYLDHETAKLDALAIEIKRTIALLKERRVALIAAAVTGQLDIGEMT